MNGRTGTHAHLLATTWSLFGRIGRLLSWQYSNSSFTTQTALKPRPAADSMNNMYPYSSPRTPQLFEMCKTQTLRTINELNPLARKGLIVNSHVRRDAKSAVANVCKELTFNSKKWLTVTSPWATHQSFADINNIIAGEWELLIGMFQESRHLRKQIAFVTETICFLLTTVTI